MTGVTSDVTCELNHDKPRPFRIRPEKDRFMARRKPAEGENSSNSTLPVPVEPKSTTPNTQRDVIKVNNANLTELKHTLDDALKRFLGSHDQFKTIHQHTDVRLVLGWLGVFVAAGTALYGYKTPFEKSKPIVWTGVIVYVFLTTIQSLYAYLIEGKIVYVGKRKTFVKRIETERITVESNTEPSTSTSPPKYDLSILYVRSTNNGKSLLHRKKVQDTRVYNAFFDEDGVLDQDIFEDWLRGLVTKAAGETE